MLVNSLRLFFFHIPRCGGTAINEFFVANRLVSAHELSVKGANLDVMYGILRVGRVQIELDHLCWEHFEYLCSPFVVTHFRKIAVVRDPVERARSVFIRMAALGDRRALPEEALTSFKHWIVCVYNLHVQNTFARPIVVDRFPHLRLSHLIPQSFFLTDKDGLPRVENVIPISQLQFVWPAILSECGVENVSELKPLQVGVHGSHAFMRRNDMTGLDCSIDDDGEAMLRAVYASDYELFSRLQVKLDTAPVLYPSSD